MSTATSRPDRGTSTARDRTARPRRQRIEVLLIVAFWVFIYMLTVGQRVIDPRGPDGLSTLQILVPGLEYLLWLLLTPGIFWLSRRFSLERDAWQRNVALHAAVAFIVAVAINAYSHATYHWLLADAQARPFSFTRSFLSLRFLDELIVYLTVLAAGFARNYFLRYRERQEEAAQLKTQAAELQAQLAQARLQTLRMQVNPHFLFNTLHAVSSLVERDPRGVRRMIARLSELLRYTLEHTAAQEVPLHQELQFLEGYLEIQRIRFQGKLEVEETIDPDVLDALVPNLILQPLVENAIKHGVSQVEGTGRLSIGAHREGASIVLSVYDNGPGPDVPAGDGASVINQGLGLENTRERLASLYGASQHFTLTAEPAGGTVARITLPYHTGADLRTSTLTETS